MATKGHGNEGGDKPGSYAAGAKGEAPRKGEPEPWRYTLRKKAPGYPVGSYIRSSGGLKSDNQN